MSLTSQQFADIEPCLSHIQERNMLQSFRLLVVLIVSFSTASVAIAGDKEDVIARSDALLAAWNGTDAETIRQHYTDDFARFAASGDLLSQGGWDWDELAQQFESGLKVTISPSAHQEVKVYGNTAVSTSYITVSVSQPDADTETTTRRLTLVYAKQGSTWKAVHEHASLLTPTQSN
jgi:ketosteroid isomerase-like protein